VDLREQLSSRDDSRCGVTSVMVFQDARRYGWELRTTTHIAASTPNVLLQEKFINNYCGSLRDRDYTTWRALRSAKQRVLLRRKTRDGHRSVRNCRYVHALGVTVVCSIVGGGSSIGKRWFDMRDGCGLWTGSARRPDLVRRASDPSTCCPSTPPAT
jgi:hypothetical protein